MFVGKAESAEGIVFGFERELIFLYGAITLAGGIERPSEIDERPDLGPVGLEIAFRSLREFNGG